MTILQVVLMAISYCAVAWAAYTAGAEKALYLVNKVILYAIILAVNYNVGDDDEG